MIFFMIFNTLLSVIAPVLLILVIVLAIKKKKKAEEEKKKQEAAKLATKLQEEKEKREILDFLEKEATDLCNVKLSENYFINLFMGWLDDTEENRVNTYYENKDILKSMHPEDNVGSVLEKFVQPDIGAMFLETQEEWDRFATGKTQEDIDDIISGEIVLTLGLYPILKDYIELYFLKTDSYCAAPARDYLKILFAMQMYAENKNSISDTELMEGVHIQTKAFEDFQNKKLQEICVSHPTVNNDFYCEKFIEFTKYDEAFVPWSKFYFTSIDNLVNDYFGDWTTRLGTAIEQLEKHPKIYNSISKGPSQYSSIYEIEDFSAENIDRIVELYKSGEIHGKYSKAKDPKYNNK